MPRKVQYIFNPFRIAGIDRDLVPDEDEDAVLDLLSDYVVGEVVDHMDDQKSPVTGRQFKRLSKDYADFKNKEVGSKKADLQLHGDLQNGIKVIKLKNGRLKITVTEDQQGKADGHNKFNTRKNNKIPPRKFIPDIKKSEHFTRDIEKGFADIIEPFVDLPEEEE